MGRPLPLRRRSSREARQRRDEGATLKELAQSYNVGLATIFRLSKKCSRMTAVTLTRTDHARRMARFYVLDVQPDLFGAWCFIREWGRIGGPGQLRHVPYPTEDEAKEALARQRRAKERRGYRSA